ncbi:MAG: hypothetical protein M0Q95_09195 [Porticoccaceae bacterium]|nr:hypothetical protein [Porticoccaceae bacterium]
MTDSSLKTGITCFLLVLLMQATRADHFGSAVNLPDASLAVFFMAGFLLRSRWIFPALCVQAAAIDYWMIQYNGVSAFCVTPAYGFLLPTYFVMWWTGARASRLDLYRFSQWLGLAGMATLSITAAHLISSGSFYLLAPYFTEHSLAEFSRRTALYFPRYFVVTAGYLTVLLTVATLAFGSRVTSRTASGIANG